MKKDTRNEVRYEFYKEELQRAEKPYVVFAALAMGIANSEEYTKAEKGRTLEILTKAYADLFETK